MRRCGRWATVNSQGCAPGNGPSSNVESVASITTADPLVISGGGLQVAADSTIGGALTMTGGSLTAQGTGIALAVTGTTTISGGSLFAEGGASLSLSQLTGYTGAGAQTTLEATGTGSTLTLANLATVTEGTSYPSETQVEALAGGMVSLPALQTLDTGPVVVESDGTGSVLNVPALTGQWLDQLATASLQWRHGR